MQYRRSSYAQGVFDTYYFEKNLQGDIIAVYNASGTVLVYYKYDAWGNITYTFYNNGSSTPVVYNPFRYRGYYYDADLGFYYLNSRYYDSNTGRFISSDRQLNNGLLGLNQFAYCENNPVRYTDYDGRDADENCTWDPDDGTIDLDGLGISACQPTYGATDSSAYGTYQIRCKVAAGDAKLGGYYYGGGSYMGGFTAQFATGGAVSVTDDMATNGTCETINNDIIDLKRSGSALKIDPFHNFSDIVDNYAGDAEKFFLPNGILYQIEGSLNGLSGRFEWIIQHQMVTHRFFVRGGRINGIPILQ